MPHIVKSVQTKLAIYSNTAKQKDGILALYSCRVFMPVIIKVNEAVTLQRPFREYFHAGKLYKYSVAAE